MLRNSIRWKLPFSYAAIALISGLASGIVLLTLLQSYYTQREYEYLRGNAGTITSVVRQMMESDMPLAAIRAHMETYSFLAQVRVRLSDPSGEVLADSGVPIERNTLSISAMPQAEATIPSEVASSRPGGLLMGTIEEGEAVILPENYARLPEFASGIEIPIELPQDQLVNNDAEYYTPVITLNFIRVPGEESGGNSPAVGERTEAPSLDGFVSVLPATSTLYGFDLSDDTTREGLRSSQEYTEAILNSSGRAIGFITLSEGPAYGSRIVEHVAGGWPISSGLAVILAAAVGWWISRSISRPLLALTAATRDMAAGNLSARADVVGTDELGMLASSFNHMARQVEETVLALRRFVADAAHEIHTPLTALQTNLELALDERRSETRRAYLERAQAQLDRLVTMTDGLLDLSRIEAGASNEQPHPILVNALIQEISELYASRSEQAGLNFVLELPEKPITLTGNRTQLRRSLCNLLDNAVKFTPNGETVRLEVCESNHGVEIRVSDTGIGIPPDEVSLVFNRFHRCRNAATYPGNGLGLAIVKSVINAHGGQICVENAAPGTRVILWLPHDLETMPEMA